VKGRTRWYAVMAALLLVAAAGLAWALTRGAGADEDLPRIGAAAEFTLTTQDNARLSLSDLRGKVVVVTFLYTACPDTCPLLTTQMARIQDRLGRDFGGKVYFLSVSVDPERDTPEVLARYADLFRANRAGWSFLTGTREEVAAVTSAYGVYARPTPDGNVEHTFLTSIVDKRACCACSILARGLTRS
jgi:protein SCO1/2